MQKRYIDYDKCIGCKQCVADCVNSFLIDKDAYGNITEKPFFKERGVCLECGHCDAICPTGAIEKQGENREYFSAEDSLLEFMSKKRTVRQYIKESVIDRTVLEKIVLAGQSAPTDRNRKTCKMLLIKEKLPSLYNEAVSYLWDNVKSEGTINPLYSSTKRMIENVDEILWDAEYLVCFVGNAQYCVDAAIAAERMQLESEMLGVSTAYRGDMKKAINDSIKCREILGMRSNEEVLVAFAMGYSGIIYHRSSIKENKKVYYL